MKKTQFLLVEEENDGRNRLLAKVEFPSLDWAVMIVVMNTSLYYRYRYDSSILINGVTLTPATEAKLLLPTSLNLTTLLTTWYKKPTAGFF